MTFGRELLPQALEKSLIVFHVLEHADQEDEREAALPLEAFLVQYGHIGIPTSARDGPALLGDGGVGVIEEDPSVPVAPAEIEAERAEGAAEVEHFAGPDPVPMEELEREVLEAQVARGGGRAQGP